MRVSRFGDGEFFPLPEIGGLHGPFHESLIYGKLFARLGEEVLKKGGTCLPSGTATDEAYLDIWFGTRV